MLPILKENSENRPLVADLGKETNSNSSEILDLSCKSTAQLPERLLERLPEQLPEQLPEKLSDLRNLRKLCPILNRASVISQLKQQSSIDTTNTAPMPMNPSMEIDTTKFTENRRSSQKRKKRSDSDGQINYYQINNLQINSQVNNDQLNNSQINCNQMNVDEIQYKLFMNDNKIDTNYINVNHTVKDISSDSHSDINSHKNYPASIGQSISHEHSIPMANSVNVEYLPTNISIPNSLPLCVPMSMQEIEKSTILTSITKASRPFKVYPRDPLVLSIGDKDTSDAYNTFREKVLKHVKNIEKESTNSKMRRTSNSTGSHMNNVDDEKNRAYLEKRKKNNEAAKRSRDARRAKEDELAIRTAFLEYENLTLKQTLNMFMKQLQEQNVKFDFKPIILDANENAPAADIVNMSS